MSDDWDRGDLAICVRQPECFACATKYPVSVDSTYMVENVSVAPGKGGSWIILLLLHGVRTGDHHPDWVPSDYFRKAEPPKAEPCNEEFRLSLKKKGPLDPIVVPDKELEDA